MLVLKLTTLKLYTIIEVRLVLLLIHLSLYLIPYVHCSFLVAFYCLSGLCLMDLDPKIVAKA